MNVISVVALAAAAALAFVPAVEGHGWIQKPLARQFCNGNQVLLLSFHSITVCAVEN